MKYEVQLKLKQILDKRNITQLQLSELSGVRQSTISDIVRGSRTVINFEHLSKISKALELKSIDEIIDFKK
ncbi:MAG: helix-turn-helix transcriptional regulator [Streptococcaceae bacterium]|nr:helix-turn-helix transcriptional regulator [Streptococcaceae bacterium]MCL2858137.1 helix-turn-helix transcriptional regulator [Streptococcaceae bacterium]